MCLRATRRRPRTMPFPTEFVVAPDIPFEVGSDGTISSRMKRYDENNLRPRDLHERYRTRRRRERASGILPRLRRPTFGEAIAAVALAMVVCTTTAFGTTVTLSNYSSPRLVHSLALRILQTQTAITNSNIRTAVNQCKQESSDFNCPVSQATYGPLSTWDTSSVTAMTQRMRTRTLLDALQWSCFALTRSHWQRLIGTSQSAVLVA